jgi:hypothetical protein
MNRDKGFDEIVLDTINNTFADLLGAGCRDLIITHFLKRFSIPKELLPTHLNTFSQELRNVFGQKETATITKAIAKRLYSELHIDFVDHEDFYLERYVNEAKVAIGDTLQGKELPEITLEKQR